MAINTLVTDYWRLTNFVISPSSIVGGGNNSQGIAQSFLITPVLNVGLATTVYVSTNLPNFINLAINTNLSFSTSSDLNISASVTGFATGFSTTFPTPFTITVSGPGPSSITSSIILNPFLFSSSIGTAIWPVGVITAPTYQYAGIGATSQATLTLNAYVSSSGPQTAIVTTFDPYLFFYQGLSTTKQGIVNFYPGFNTGSINVGYLPYTRNASITTSVTFALQNSTGLTTVAFTFSGLTDYKFIFGPLVTNTPRYSWISPVQYPVNLTYQLGFGSNSSNLIGGFSTSIPALSTTYSSNTLITANWPSIDTKLGIFVTNINGITSQTQTYYTNYYSQNTGYAKAMGYDYYGELTVNFFNKTTIDSSSNLGVGTQSKIPMYNSLIVGPNNIIKTASGLHHNLVLDTSGKVFATGDNHYGQLSIPTVGYTTNFLTQISLSTAAVDIYANNNSSYIITNDNSLYSFGSNNLNQLGFASNGASFTTSASFVTNNVYLLSVYNNQGYLVQYSDPYYFNLGIWSFGAIATNTADNSYGSLQNLTEFNTPTQFTYNGVSRTVSNIFFYAIDVGFNHTLASCTWFDNALGINSSGIIAWGYNNYMQLGTSYPLTGYTTIPNILTKFNQQGNIVPLDFSTNIVANNQYSLVTINSSGISSSYYYGPSSSTYFGGWIPYSSITTSIGVAQSFINDTVYKIAKAKDHLVFVTNFGSAYVTGYAEQFNLKNIDYYSSTNKIFNFIENSSLGISETQSKFYYTSTGVYSILYNGLSSTGLQTSNLPIIRATSSSNILKNNLSGDILGLCFPTEIQAWVYTYPNLKFLNFNWSSYISSNTLSDIAIGRSFLSGTSYLIPFFVASYIPTNNYFTNTIYNFIFSFTQSGSFIGLSTTSSISFINESYITCLSAGMYESRLEKYTIGSSTYDWFSSNNNLIAGFQDGSLIVYSDANLGFGTYYSFTNSNLIETAQFKSITTSPVSSMKVCYSNKLGSNVLFVSQFDKSLSIYSFGTSWNGNQNGYKGGLSLLNYTQLSSTYGYINRFLGQFSLYSDYTIVTSSQNYIGILQFDNSSIFLSQYATQISGGNVYSVSSTNSSSKDRVSPNNVSFILTNQNIIQEWYVPTQSFEIGLSYWNSGASPSLLTKNGSITGIGISYINHASTSDNFTIIVDNNSTLYY